MERTPESRYLTAQGPDGIIVIDPEIMKKPGARMVHHGKTGIVEWVTSTVQGCKAVSVNVHFYDDPAPASHQIFVDTDANDSHLPKALDYFARYANSAGSISDLVVEQQAAIGRLSRRLRELVIVGIVAAGIGGFTTVSLQKRVKELEETARDNSDEAAQVEPSTPPSDPIPVGKLPVGEPAIQTDSENHFREPPAPPPDPHAPTMNLPSSAGKAPAGKKPAGRIFGPRGISEPDLE